MADSLKAKMDEAVPAGMAEFNVPGCAFAIIRDARVSDVGVFGVADVTSRAPVTPKTRFSLQSISKPIAAWAMMKLVERGQLDLDTPISRYLKRWKLPASEKFDLDLVTPRRLLSHHAGVIESGLRPPRPEPEFDHYTLVQAMDNIVPPATEEQKRHYAFWKLPDDEPVSVTFAPGEGWHYSNAGFAMLQLALEDITGRSYRDFMAEEIFRPLGMTDSSVSKEASGPYAGPHGRDGQPNTDYRWICGASAAVYSTILDLAAFALAEMTGPNGEPAGRGVLTPQSIATMFASHGLADLVNGAQFEAGLGHILLKDGGPLNVHHSGGSIGWRSIYSIFPETGDGICMLMNGEAANDLWIPIVREWRDGLRAG